MSELEGQFPPAPDPEDFISGLTGDERQQLLNAAHLVVERVVQNEPTRLAVRELLGLCMKEEEQDLFTSKLKYPADVAARMDDATRGILNGLQAADNQLTDGTRLSELIGRLNIKD